MTAPFPLPGLKLDPHGRTLAYSETSDPKGMLHTTETGGKPDYRGWTVLPQITVLPVPNVGISGWHHIPLEQAGFALRNLSGGVETNTDNVVQIELIGTCEKGGPGYYWPDADDAVLLDIGRKVIVPASRYRGIPLRALRFQSYPASYGARGNTNTVRLSGPAFDTYSGWMGHQHAPENVHGDPGAFPWDRMMQLLEENGMDWTDKTVENQNPDTKADRPKVSVPDGVENAWKFAREAAGEAAASRAEAAGGRAVANDAVRYAGRARDAAVSAKTAAIGAAETAARVETAVAQLGAKVDDIAGKVVAAPEIDYSKLAAALLKSIASAGQGQ